MSKSQLQIMCVYLLRNIQNYVKFTESANMVNMV